MRPKIREQNRNQKKEYEEKEGRQKINIRIIK